MIGHLVVAKRTRTRTALLLMCIVVIASVGVFTLSSQDGVRQQEPSTYNPAQSNWQHSLAHRGIVEISEGRGADLKPLSAYFGSREPMPNTLRKRISRNLGGVGPLHLRFAQAQYLVSSSGPSFWIVEGRGVTCMFRDGLPASSCRTSVSAREDGIWLGTYSTRQAKPGRPVAFLALGVLPQAAGTVVAHTGKSKITVPVRSHIWVLRSRFPIDVDTHPGRTYEPRGVRSGG